MRYILFFCTDCSTSDKQTTKTSNERGCLPEANDDKSKDGGPNRELEAAAKARQREKTRNTHRAERTLVLIFSVLVLSNLPAILVISILIYCFKCVPDYVCRVSLD